MATGKANKLTGQVGEHLVSAVLGTRGFYASPYSGNVPGFDVTAVESETLKSFPVQVKTSRSGSLVQSTIDRSEEHTSELQSLMRISYAVFCLKKKKKRRKQQKTTLDYA